MTSILPKTNPHRQILSLALPLILAVSMNGCGQRPHQVSAIDVTDVHHTPSKRQSIGNCWLYATATWVESLALTETNESHNISETYWTYWHWYDSLRFAGDEINTGGN